MNRKNILIWSVFLLASLVSALFMAWHFYFKESGSAELLQEVQTKKVDFEDEEQIKYSEALMSGDKDGCNALQDDKLKQTCNDVILDLNFYNEALSRFDKKLCEEIASDSRRADCIRLIDSSVTHFEKSDPEYLAMTYAKGSNEKIIEEYENLLVTKPENTFYMAVLASKYAEKGLSIQEQGGDQSEYIKKALLIIESAKKKEPNNADVYRVEGYIYEIKPDIFKALEAYSKSIELQEENVLAYAGRGHAYNILGVLDSALSDLRKAAEYDKEKKEVFVYANLCRLCSSRDDLMDEAIKNCELAIKFKDDKSSFRSDSYQNLATIYIKQKKLDLAAENLEKAKAFNPNDPNLYLTFANLNVNTGEFEKSLENSKKAMELSPNKATAYKMMADVYYLLGDYDQAVLNANIAIKKTSDDVTLLAPNKPPLLKQCYGLLSDIYKNKGDKENEQKYLGLMNQVFIEKVNNVN